jgi:hypothetical protein
MHLVRLTPSLSRFLYANHVDRTRADALTAAATEVAREHQSVANAVRSW